MSQNFRDRLKAFQHSIWLFPAVLTILLFAATALQLSGSSIGVYNTDFNGDAKDPNLVFGKPRTIRSDEWVVNTQMTLAQVNAGFPEVNPNLGNGVDMSLLVDAPYAGWTQLFKPHNWSFFILPFSYAFAFKWWVMGYFLLLSTYFFVLSLLPGRKLFAALIAVGFFFSPFIQWWYQYITLAPLYCILAACSLLVYAVKTTTNRQRILSSVALAYALVCFALVQYPPFQIPCALCFVAFSLGYLVEQWRSGNKELNRSLALCVVAGVTAICITALFIYQKRGVVETIANTAYPGKRIVESGGYNLPHLLSSSFSAPFQSNLRANNYSVPQAGAVNQSESSNFMLLLPFLLLPIAVLLYREKKAGRELNYPLLCIALAFVGCLVWLFVPNLGVIGKLTFLDKVPHPRLLIGIGLLNLMAIVLLSRYLLQHKPFSTRTAAYYGLGTWLIILAVGWQIHSQFPLFLGSKMLLVLSIFLPICMFLLLRRKLIASASVLLGFSILSTAFVNPLYHGTAVLSDNQLSSAIRAIPSQPRERWAVEDSSVQSFAFMNGKPSLTGIYEYPQKELWNTISPRPDPFTYDRYAHVNFVFDRDEATNSPTRLANSTADHFGVFTEPCGDFIRRSSTRYIVTSGRFSSDEATCASLIRSVPTPVGAYYIYKLHY